MKNLRIGGAIVMLLGLSVYFLAGKDLETIAGAICGAGFGLVVYSFFSKSVKQTGKL